MSKIRRLTHKNNLTELWLSVNLPVMGGKEVRRYDFPQHKVEGLIEISEEKSALLLDDEKQIVVKMPIDELREQFYNASTHMVKNNGVLDLSKVTGCDTDSLVLKEIKENISDVQDTALKITLFGHYRLDENKDAKYMQITIDFDNIYRISESGSAPNTTRITLHRAISARSLGSDGRSRWWIDIHPDELQERINLAKINNEQHIDLRNRTRKRFNYTANTVNEGRR